MFSKAKIEGNFLNLRKVSRKHIILNDERPKAFSLRSGIRQEYLHAHHIFSQVTTVVANAKRQERKNKYPERKERIQIPLFAEYMIVYVENITESTKVTPGLINEFSKAERY